MPDNSQLLGINNIIRIPMPETKAIGATIVQNNLVPKTIGAFDVFSNTQKQAEEFKTKGNEFSRNNNTQKAIEYYKKAIETKPDYSDAYFNLAKIYKKTGDYDNAIINYNILLKLTPQDLESISCLGECYKQKGQNDKAVEYFKKALIIDPKYDLANRFLKETENAKLALTNPTLAKQERIQYGNENIKQALNIIANYTSSETLDKIRDVTFKFDKTDSINGKPNIAQYEDYHRQIKVTDEYVYAAPEIVAAYIVHENVHGSDKDPYTSIKEEQDAYRESVKYWIKNNNGIKDPEMDFAQSLYNISPEELDKKVAEVYSSRDGSIPQTSPNHGIAAQSISGFMYKVKKSFANALGHEDPLKYQAISERLLSEYR